MSKLPAQVSSRLSRGTSGCAAACLFLILIGVCVWLILAFGYEPCAAGPCSDDEERKLELAAWLIVASTVALGFALRNVTNRWAKGGDERVPWRLLIASGGLLLAAAALFSLVMS